MVKKEEVKDQTTEEPKEDVFVPGKGEEIWNKIKDYQLDLFALPNQSVEKHCRREITMEVVFPDHLYLVLKSAAVFPALEDALNKIKLGKNEKFELEQQARYTVVKIVPKI